MNDKSVDDLRTIYPEKIAEIKPEVLVAVADVEESKAVIEVLQEGFLERNADVESCKGAFDVKIQGAITGLAEVANEEGFKKLRSDNPLTLGLVRAIIEHYDFDKKLADDTKFDDLADILKQKYKFDGTTEVELKEAVTFDMTLGDMVKLEGEAVVYAMEILKKDAESEKNQLDQKINNLKEEEVNVEEIINKIKKEYPKVTSLRGAFAEIAALKANLEALKKENSDFKAKLGNQQPQGQPAAKITEDSGLDTVVPVAQAAVENLQQVTKNKKLLELGLGKSFENFSNSLDKIGKELKKIEEAQKPEEGKKDKNVDSDHNPNPNNAGSITRQLGVDFGMVNGKFVETNGTLGELSQIFQWNPSLNKAKGKVNMNVPMDQIWIYKEQRELFETLYKKSLENSTK